MNAIKKVIQKEEYISLAINKYIIQNADIPNVSDNDLSLDWTKLITDDYLGANFNKKNPITLKDMKVVFDTKKNAYIFGAMEDITEFNTEYNYLYNFYINNTFRVNTIPPKDITKENLIKGSQVIYSKIQKEIIDLLNNSEQIVLDYQSCPTANYYYELKNQKITYKYCKGSTSIDVYQNSPIYLEDINDLSYVKGNIGDKAYVKKNASWYEYYYQGDVDIPWIPSGTGSSLTAPSTDSTTLEDRILSYIPDSKDLVIRRDGGCMLANGDIFCWGNNKYKKAGIESYGQLDNTLSPDYVNTPVMLKVQINDSERSSKNWYNNPYRVKFEKMSLNSTNVCAISPIFDYSESGVSKKFGGDLYCNGEITYGTFENMNPGVNESSILKRSIFFANGKDDQLNNSTEIYLTDIVMVEDTVAVLSDEGKIYTFGKNYQGALGIGSSDKFITQFTPIEVKNDSNVEFKKIFALRDIKGFGAIDSNNLFWMWGERPNGTVCYEPTLLSSIKQFNPDAIFTNSKDFVLKDVDKFFYRTKDDLSIEALTSVPSSALSVSIYDEDGQELYLYVNENMQLEGSQALLECRNKNGNRCTGLVNLDIFQWAIDELNTKSNTINGKKYANFSNVSIFKLDHILEERFDDFESNTTGWSLKRYTDASMTTLVIPQPAISTDQATETTPDNSVSPITQRVDPTRVLGRFLIGKDLVEKDFDLGSLYANYEVEVEFDFYEIDSWDMERFNVYLNDELFTDDGFIHDNHPSFTDTNDTGIYTLNLGTHYNSDQKYNDEKYHYKLKTKLDANGKLNIKFKIRELKDGEYGDNPWDYGQDLYDESWAVDNVHIKVKETGKYFVGAMTGIGSASQLYSWGNTARSIPILSTSLYDVSKISTINKLFITQDSEKQNQMSFSEFFNNGKLFLKYPTYIGGFDYAFYFK